MLKYILLVFCFVLTIQAQTLPTHFTGVGLGFQNSANQKASGWFDTCVLTVDKLYGCLAVDYSNGTTSNRAEVHGLVFQYKACGLFGTGGAGASTGATGGVGGTFDAGGLIACKIHTKLLRVPGLAAVFSGSWNKRNVVEAPDVGTALKTFGSQTVFRFGVGKTW